MNLIKYTLLFSLFGLSSFAQKNSKSLAVLPGVSIELATWRGEMISNTQYALQMDIPEKKDQPITAATQIEFTLKSIPDTLQLDFKQSEEAIKTITVNGKPARTVLKNEHVLIDGKLLVKGINKIDINFIAGNGALNRNDEYLYALFVPDRARTAFPCFDQPDLKANFTLRIAVPKDWKVLANAPVRDSVNHNSRISYQFGKSDKLPTYLFSFVAGKFSKKTTGIDHRNMELLYRETDKNKLSQSLDSIFIAHGDALNFLEKWTGIPYPFQKIGFATIPDFQFGGMEHPGTVLYKASSLFLDDSATKDQFISRSNLISHETAHMWFGDLVTMKWFNDVWMKEVFANFMADKVTEKLMGEKTFELKFLQDHYPAAYGVDRTLGANPIRQQLNNLKDAGSMYGNIIYHKAPIMMRQLEALIGKEGFQKGIREYLNTYANKNATWNDLIKILQKNTTNDLNSWNKVWVNLPGRPVFTYEAKYKGDQISSFIIRQMPEQGEKRLWPQVFSLKLVYPDGVKTIKVNMDREQVALSELQGARKPSYFLFNSDGMGYGLFPADQAMYDDISKMKEPLDRASVYINIYENTLAGNGIKPLDALNLFLKSIDTEQNEMNLRVLTGYIAGLYWGFISPEVRFNRSTTLEQTLWAAMQKRDVANQKKVLFNAYQNIFLSSEAANNLKTIWKNQQAPAGVKLAEDDYTSLALSLALRSDTASNFVTEQITRASNADRKNRLIFLAPALSNNPQKRDQFFNSLKDLKNRSKEAWVSVGLSYLHHPLRQKTSQKYLARSLNMLEEIQATGDIFFPQSWVSAIFGSYQTKEAYQVVDDFIKNHPDYNPLLKDKILQGTDNLRRAKMLKVTEK